MATTINDIIKTSLERLRNEKLSLTPSNYSKIFCQVAKEKKVITEDCQKVKSTLERLDKIFQQEASRHKVEDIESLINFFVAIINRSNTANTQKTIQNSLLLTKRLLETITLLKNKKATKLANVSIERLETNTQPDSIELVRDKWLDFITNYNDDFISKLDGFGTIRKDDLELLINDVYKILNEGDNESAYIQIAPLIIATLTPSIASSINDDLATICQDLRSKPELLSSKAIQDDIKKFIKKRIEIDKKEVQNKISSLNSLLDSINQKILDLLGLSSSHSKEVSKIKLDLQALDMSKDSFETIQSKLIAIATSLESETQSLNEHMESNKKTIAKLHHKINQLQNTLIEVKKENKEDFLTHVGNKRALHSQLEQAEDSYIRYQTDFSICFFDLDHFKVINDTYGHEAGDVILATFGKILNKYIRKVDFVGRYGGEEFLVILPSTELKSAIHFAEKIRKIIENFKFIYKKERINVAVSAGIAERKYHKNLKDLIAKADSNLYEAKDAGRNQVFPKPL